MPNALHRTLQTYFRRARRTVSTTPENPTATATAATATATPSSSGNSAASRLFSACRFPKTQSFALDRTVEPADAVREYLNSLYLTDDSDHPPEFTSNSGSQTSGFSTDSVDISQDLASAMASERFFIVPGTTNSILEECTAETAAKMPATSETKTALVEDGIAVTTFSPDPFVDFRKSMQEMVEARAKSRAVDWEYLEELFFCYMKLNHPRDHKFILGAFADLLASLGVSREVAEPKPAGKTGSIRIAVAGATTANGRRRRKGQIQSDKSRDRPAVGLRIGKSSVS
ncbi:unnamed protein product [Victoria cruziana]